MYVLAHCIAGDQLYTYGDPGVTQGYIHLRPAGTGTYLNGKAEYDLTWKNDTLLLSSSPLVYRYYPADQMEDGIATLILYSSGYDMVIFRAVDDSPADAL